MKTALLSMLLLVVAYPAAMAQQNSLSTEPLECSIVKAGQKLTRKTAAVTLRSAAIKAYATVQLQRDPGDENANACTVVYRLFVAEGDKPPVMVKDYSDDAEDNAVGVDMVGASKNEMQIAADFWWAAGDSTGHRPVIYNVKTKSVSLRALNDEILGQLPSCDYSEEFMGVTGSGKAIIRVPKSVYANEGCPAQGKWLFNLHNGSVQRVK